MTTCCITWVVPSLCRMPPFLKTLKLLFYSKVACHGFSGISCVCVWEAWWNYQEDFMDSSGLAIEWQPFPAHVPTLKILNSFTALTCAPSHPFNIPKILCKIRRTDKRDQRKTRERLTQVQLQDTQLSGQVRQACWAWWTAAKVVGGTEKWWEDTDTASSCFIAKGYSRQCWRDESPETQPCSSLMPAHLQKKYYIQTFSPVGKSLMSYLSFLKQNNYFTLYHLPKQPFSTILKSSRRGPKRELQVSFSQVQFKSGNSSTEQQ